MGAAITALLDLIKQFLCVKQTEMVNKPILDVVKDKRALKKATNYTEQILSITDNYVEHFTKRDLKRYNTLKKKFNKND